ncbi:MAG: DNA gyrase inhibitor YacG [Beijerinckiaceae bacterium]
MPVPNPGDRFAERSGETPARPCPICGKPAAFTERPFCSKRCANVDLHRWLGGVYAIPAALEPDPERDGVRKPGEAKSSGR